MKKGFCYQEFYYLVKNKDSIVEKRLAMVHHALEYGIRDTMRVYNCSRNTVRRWLRRYLSLGKSGLVDLSKCPRHINNILDSESQFAIFKLLVDKLDKKHHITSVNVYRALNLDCCYETVNRYVNKYLGNKKTRKDNKSNGGCIDFKQDLSPFDLVQIDIKYLTDIKSLKPYFKKCNDRLLAKYQFTFRDVSTGLSLVAYGDEKSETLAHLFLKKVIVPFLSQIPHCQLKNVIVQTDNGKEFTNKDVKTYCGEPKKTEFTRLIEETFMAHKLIIPGHCTAQSEVESFHWAIERDCLAWFDIVDNDTLIYYVDRYMTWFNNKKRWNKDYSPLQKAEDYFGCKINLPKPIILSV